MGRMEGEGVMESVEMEWEGEMRGGLERNWKPRGDPANDIRPANAHTVLPPPPKGPQLLHGPPARGWLADESSKSSRQPASPGRALGGAPPK